MSTTTIRLDGFPDHPVDAAIDPTLDEMIALLAHPRAYDPEGDEGEPALILKGCVRRDGRVVLWVADQCTHSQMSEHLSGSQMGMPGEFYVLVRPDMEIEFTHREHHASHVSIGSIAQSLDRATLRTRLGRFPRPASPRRTGAAAFR